jgi:hypothetical protein
MADHTSIIVIFSLAYITLVLLVVAGSSFIGRRKGQPGALRAVRRLYDAQEHES